MPTNPPDGPITFTCPCCGSKHERGYFNAVDVFRCLRCGYQGHGLHPDADIDSGLYREWKETNEWNRAHGIEEVPLFEEHPNCG